MSRRPWWALAGLVIFAAGLVTLILDLPGWNTLWYTAAWWGYLLLLDAAVHHLGGRSWVADRPRELLVMLFWSVPFWYLFEAYNLRLENWYYVFVLRQPVLQEISAWFAYATVLPACCFHAELVRALGWFETTRWRPLRVGRGTRFVCVALGVASIVAPLLWPRYAFPLVWGATLWLPELWNRRAGAPSLLRDLERGDPRRLLRLLLGGLLAGLVWESLNFWARTKWIYTVPGFEEWKLFEMPFLGFLGFPFLAVSAFAFYVLIRRQAQRGGVRLAFLVVAALIASHLAFLGLHARTVRSERPILEELQDLSPRDVATLRAAGVPSPERLARRAVRQDTAALAATTGIDPVQLAAAAEAAALGLHKGIGLPAAYQLRQAGIHSVEQLATADPEKLWRRLVTLSSGPTDTPRRAEVAVWVRAARLGRGVRR